VTTARRRVLRSAPPAVTDARQQQRLIKAREQLAAEHVALARWMTRLRRAFNAVEKHQSRIGRLERRLSQPG
jgi:hypothetical protein